MSGEDLQYKYKYIFNKKTENINYNPEDYKKLLVRQLVRNMPNLILRYVNPLLSERNSIICFSLIVSEEEDFNNIQSFILFFFLI